MGDTVSVRVLLPRRLAREGHVSGEPVWVQGRKIADADESGLVTVQVMGGDRMLHQMRVPSAYVECWEAPGEDGSRERPLKLWL